MPPTYKQTQGNTYSGIIEIATITPAIINAMPAAQFGEYQVVNAIPANILMIGLYMKTNIPFASVTRTIKYMGMSLTSGDRVNPAAYPITDGFFVEADIQTVNREIFMPPTYYWQVNKPAQNIYIIGDWFVNNNPQDYTTGEIKVYLEYKSFPTLS